MVEADIQDYFPKPISTGELGGLLDPIRFDPLARPIEEVQPSVGNFGGLRSQDSVVGINEAAGTVLPTADVTTLGELATIASSSLGGAAQTDTKKGGERSGRFDSFGESAIVLLTVAGIVGALVLEEQHSWGIRTRRQIMADTKNGNPTGLRDFGGRGGGAKTPPTPPVTSPRPRAQQRSDRRAEAAQPRDRSDNTRVRLFPSFFGSRDKSPSTPPKSNRLVSFEKSPPTSRGKSGGSSGSGRGLISFGEGSSPKKSGGSGGRRKWYQI